MGFLLLIALQKDTKWVINMGISAAQVTQADKLAGKSTRPPWSTFARRGALRLITRGVMQMQGRFSFGFLRIVVSLSILTDNFNRILSRLRIWRIENEL